ncbi:MAG TPA: AMP-binding protein [Solirubrobacterales bacterium]
MSREAEREAVRTEAVEMRLHDIVEQNACWYPEHFALGYRETALTWSDFSARMHRLAAGLLDAGVEEGERIAVLANNALDYVVLQYALSLTGGILVPVNTRLATPEIAYILEDSGARILLYDSENAEAAKAVAAEPGVSVELVDLADRDAPSGLWGWIQRTLADPGTRVPDERAGDWRRPHVILYTGGTTGRPKGAMISHRRNLIDGMSVGSAFGLRPHERFLSYSPLSHTAAWDYIKAYFLVGGGAVVLPKFDAEEALAQIQLHRCNGMWAVPLMLRQIIESPSFASADLSSVKLIAYSAYDPSELMIRVLEAFRDRGAKDVRLGHGYGLTEGGPFVTVLRPEEAEQDPASVGTPVPGLRVALLDADGNEVPRGEVGEVCVRSSGIMEGYWHRPDATADAFRDGWLHTGDLGRINELGHLQIVDRQKDMIRTAGENVFAKEVEMVLMEHPAVLDCAVIGRKDERYDERVTAVIVVSDEVTEDELREFARERMARFKVPKEFIYVDSIPKTSAGKTAKAELRKRYS